MGAYTGCGVTEMGSVWRTVVGGWGLIGFRRWGVVGWANFERNQYSYICCPNLLYLHFVKRRSVCPHRDTGSLLLRLTFQRASVVFSGSITHMWASSHRTQGVDLLIHRTDKYFVKRFLKMYYRKRFGSTRRLFKPRLRIDYFDYRDHPPCAICRGFMQTFPACVHRVENLIL